MAIQSVKRLQNLLRIAAVAAFPITRCPDLLIPISVIRVYGW